MNLVMLPMWVLSGVFFASTNFPDAMQPFIRVLPLTALIDALRAVINEGQALTTLPAELAFWPRGEPSRSSSRCGCSAGNKRTARPDDSFNDKLRHDFKNHLGIILGFVDLLLEDVPPDDPKRGDLEQIQALGGCRARPAEPDAAARATAALT